MAQTESKKVNSDVAALSVEDIAASYGHHRVFEGVSFSVQAGETVGLIGLNGAGKTTLIKTILALRDYDKGRILIDGQDRQAKSSRMRMAFLPERFDPPWFLSGLEFIRFSMSLYNKPFDKDYICAESEKLDLDPAVLGRRVQTYSKGMRQKLGILATLATGCPLLILDEPMSGLDPRARKLVKDYMQSARAAGRTIFLSSHMLSDMPDLCDRVLVLNKGHILFNGAPSDLMMQQGADDLESAFLDLIAIPDAA